MRQVGYAIALVLITSSMAHAGGAAMPWDNMIENVVTSLSGPFVRAIIILAIVGFGAMLAFGGSSGAMRNAMGILFGLSLAAAAATFGPDFFGFTGAAALIPSP